MMIGANLLNLITVGYSILLLFNIDSVQSLVCIACDKTTCNNQTLWKRVPNCEKDYEFGETGVCYTRIILLDDDKTKVTLKGCAPAKSLPGQSPNYTFDCGDLTKPKTILCETCNDMDECNSASKTSWHLIYNTVIMIGLFLFSF